MFTAEELRIVLDAVMCYRKLVAEVPQNDGSNLPEIDELQHKIEALLSYNHAPAGSCAADAQLVCVRAGIAVTIILNCALQHQSDSEAHFDDEFGVYWYLP